MKHRDEKVKILIVDDDAFLLDMYAMKFSDSGYDVLAASSADQALDILEENQADLSFALIDLVMPEMDGFELLENANQKGYVDKVNFIVLSNLSQEDDVNRAKALKAVGYIVKANFTPQEVVEKVKEIIDGLNKK